MTEDAHCRAVAPFFYDDFHDVLLTQLNLHQFRRANPMCQHFIHEVNATARHFSFHVAKPNSRLLRISRFHQLKDSMDQPAIAWLWLETLRSSSSNLPESSLWVETSSRRRTKARTIWTLISTACRKNQRTGGQMMAPCWAIQTVKFVARPDLRSQFRLQVGKLFGVELKHEVLRNPLHCSYLRDMYAPCT